MLVTHEFYTMTNVVCSKILLYEVEIIHGTEQPKRDPGL
jgi:hypothetical protein